MQSNLQLDLISCEAARTLPGLFRSRLERAPQSPAYMQFDSARGKWRSYTWGETGRLVARWQLALTKEQFAPGERVAVLLRNSVEWVCFDQAAQSLGLVVVPLYPADASDNIAYILADSGARLLLVGTPGRWETLAPLCASSTQLKKVLFVQHLNGPNKTTGPSETVILEGVDDWLARAVPSGIDEADRHPEDPENEDHEKQYADEQAEPDKPAEPDPQALATLVYTSGTTGRPKGVMLSHYNILWNAEAVLKAIPGYREDVYLSLLPLSHMFERTVGYYVPIMAGSTVGFARSLKDLSTDMGSIRPTLLIAVPQIYEGIRTKMRQQLEGEGRLARSLFDWTLAVGWERFSVTQKRQGQGQPRWRHTFAWPLLRRLVADKVLARLGGRLRIAVSGGGPLYGETARFFIGLGLPLVQGYGLTEASPVLAANRPEDNIPDSVGPALPGVEIRIGDDDELLVRSHGIMLGYWNKPEETHAAIDADGWLHTGDKTRISDDHIFISGRIKEILVTSTGEKVPPGDLEMAITQDSLFDQAMVAGENQPYLIALLVLNQHEWEGLAKSLNLKADDSESLSNPAAKNAAMQRIKSALRGFSKYARVRAVYMTLEPWRVENGLLTPTMKLKRSELQKRFADKIADLYRQRASP
ncbi:AMP-dependent synthetase/ligase [Nitrosovibrio tenuis]|uniref:Long-chain acyl-CoA synthetase n=1 Tax=Nitrosovibrio tenuis TaxID=1233 RepID=A0A1H7IVF7_9PROT|nr:long-chain fatty acid--CoA ligase [Nitrosovibrio tenuis]SEK65640.1 long-chain acyl-CoA synthetase [Nitrosovibrio tenuis]